MNGKMSMQTEREVPLLMQRKPVATLNEYTGKPVMKSAHWAYESAAGGFPSVRPPGVAAHELPPDGGTKAALCAAYSAFTNVKTEFANFRLSAGIIKDYPVILPVKPARHSSIFRSPQENVWEMIKRPQENVDGTTKSPQENVAEIAKRPQENVNCS